LPEIALLPVLVPDKNNGDREYRPKNNPNNAEFPDDAVLIKHWLLHDAKKLW